MTEPNRDNYIIIVTGVPGTGKTTIGRLLASDLSCYFTDSSRLLKSYGLAHPDPSGRDTSIVTRDAIKKASSLLLNGCYVLETLYPDFWIDELHNSIPFVLYLRTHPLELCRRLQGRPWKEAKILENCASEALNVISDILYPYSDMVFEVDTTRRQPQTVLDLLWTKVESWSVGVGLDWLQVDDSILDELSRWLATIDAYKYGKPY